MCKRQMQGKRAWHVGWQSSLKGNVKEGKMVCNVDGEQYGWITLVPLGFH